MVKTTKADKIKIRKLESIYREMAENADIVISKKGVDLFFISLSDWGYVANDLVEFNNDEPYILKHTDSEMEEGEWTSGDFDAVYPKI